MSTSGGLARRYKFADVTLDSGRHCVWRGAEPIPLSKLTFELLRVLVLHAPNVVSRDELAAETWGSHRVVTPENLAKRVMLLRQALGDDAEQPRYIERVRGQGYRLIPEVSADREEEAPQAVAEEPSASGAPASARKRPLALLAAGAAAIALLTTAAAWLGSEGLRTPSPGAHARSIAVLPFENRSVAQEDALFIAEGIHDDLITRLAAISDLKVIPRASVMDYSAQPRSRRHIGDELGVGALLDGSVQRSGDMVRVNVQLIDVRTEGTIWGESYDERFTEENVLAIQRKIATAVAHELQAKLTPEEASQLARGSTQNMRALDLYLSGRDYERPPFAYWGLAALQYERAVEEDPDFALAHARLSLANLLAYYNVDWDHTRVEAAKLAAEEAVRLQPDLAIARIATAFYLLSVAGDLERAADELSVAAPHGKGEPQFFVVRALLHERLGKRQAALADRAAALSLNPRDPTMMLDMAIWHSRAREYEEAQRLVNRALDIRPDFLGAAMFKAELSLFRDGDAAPIRSLRLTDFDDDPGRRARLVQLQWLGALYERDFDAAARLLEPSHETEREAERRRGSVPYLSSMAITLRAAGKPEQARELVERGLHRIGDRTGDHWRVWRAMFLAGSGEGEEAVRLARQILAETPLDVSVANDICLWAVLDVLVPSGAAAEAIAVLREYLSRPGTWSIEGLLRDPRLDPLRDEAEFRLLVDEYRRT